MAEFVTGMTTTDIRAHWRSIGQLFHQQLETQLPDTAHAPDDAHNEAVGQALVDGISYRNPQLAAVEYNEWARAHGAAEITYVSTISYANGRVEVILDIVTALISVDEDFTVKVIEQRRPEPKWTGPFGIRELRADEWDRLTDLPHAPDGPLPADFMPDPKSTTVLIAEQDGQIIAFWMAIPLVHMEGFWIHPEHRKLRARLPLHLVKQMEHTLARRGIPRVFSWAEHDEIADYLERLGMKKLDVATYVYDIPPTH